MGLDMYLTKNVFVGAEFEHRDVTGTIEIYSEGVPIDINLNRVSHISEQVAYWRKANAIHNWMVENIQGGVDDCGEYYFSNEDMQALLDTVNDVLGASTLVTGNVSNGYMYSGGEVKEMVVEGKIIKDSSIAEELLPTNSGFFFGGTDYDHWYYKDLEYTKSILEEIIQTDGPYFYRSSW